MSCIRIEILNPPSYTPASLLEDNGVLVLDISVDTDIRESKEVGRLHSDNSVKKEKSITYNLPATDKNSAALREHISPNKYGRDYDPLDCRVWSGGVVLEYTKIYIQGTDDGSGEILAILLTPDHWISKAAGVRLNEIDYGQASFTNHGVGVEMQTRYRFQDSDPGHYWLLGDFGQPLAGANGIELEYIRPVLSALHGIREGFCHIGWDVEFPLLETDRGRQLWMYLLRENYNENPYLKDRRRFIVRTSAEQSKGAFNLDEVITDPDSGWRSGRQTYILKSGESRFKIEGKLSGNHAGVQGNPNPNEGEYFDVLVTIRRRNQQGSKTVLTEGIFIEVDKSREGYISAVSKPIPHQRGDEVRVQLRSGPEIFGERVDIKFEIEPVKTYYSNGDIIDWREVINPEYTLLDLVKGISHAFQAHYVTDWNLRKVTFYPPFDVEYGGQEVEGFYDLDAPAEDLTDIMVLDSEIRTIQDRRQSRYINIGWKASQDSYIREEWEKPEDGAPLYGVRVDLGEDFEDGRPEERLNPFFEPTMNRWVSMRADYEVPVNVPVLWDNKDGQDRSYNIGPRLLMAMDWGPQYYDDGTDYVQSAWEFLGENQNNVPRMADVAGWFVDASGTLEDEDLRYGVKDDSLYNKLWKKFIQFTLNNVRVEYLLFIDRNKARDLSFRKPYTITNGTTKLFGWIEEIRDRSECEEVATPVKFIPIISDFDCEPDIIGLEQCRNDVILSDTRLGDCITFGAEYEGETPNNELKQWQYVGASGWAGVPGGIVCDATGEFTYRHTASYGSGCRDVVRSRTVNPCENFPELIWDVFIDASGNSCFTVEVGGDNAKTIVGVDLDVSFDGGAYQAYTEGEEMCGQWGEVCVSGTVEYGGACPDIILGPECKTFPPDGYPCEDNEIGVNCVSATGDCGEGLKFVRTGLLVAPVASDIIFYQCPGEQWKYWAEEEVLCCDPVKWKRVVTFCDDVCPTLCEEGQCNQACTPFEAGTPTNVSVCNDGIT